MEKKFFGEGWKGRKLKWEKGRRGIGGRGVKGVKDWGRSRKGVDEDRGGGDGGEEVERKGEKGRWGEGER
jgi:hypothetical protein